MRAVGAPSASVWGDPMAQVRPRLTRPASALPGPVDDIGASSAGHRMRGSLPGRGAETLAPDLGQVLCQPRRRPLACSIGQFNQWVPCARPGWRGAWGRAGRADGNEHSRQASGGGPGGQGWRSSVSTRASHVVHRHPGHAATPCASPAPCRVFHRQTPLFRSGTIAPAPAPCRGSTGSRLAASGHRGDGPCAPRWNQWDAVGTHAREAGDENRRQASGCSHAGRSGTSLCRSMSICSFSPQVSRLQTRSLCRM
jgi:hypothetical protein